MFQQDNRRVKQKKEDAAKEDKSRSRRQVIKATIRPASPALHCGATEWGMLADLAFENFNDCLTCVLLEDS